MRKTVKVLLTVALAVLMVCTLVACGETDTQQTGNDVKYTISFDSNGGSQVANLVVDGKSEIFLPRTTKDRYSFAGWFVDNDTFNVRFNLAYITANPNKTSIKLYAKWTIKQYMVTFDSNGGSNVAPITKDCNTSVTKPTDPTRNGYAFLAWCKDSNLATIFEFEIELLTKDTTLYAKWIKETSPEFFGFTFTDSTNTAYSIKKKADITLPNEVILPSSYNGVPVTSIGERAFKGCSGLTSVTIGSGVTSIGGYAFSGCSGLTSVTIGSGVTSIGDYAFYDCGGLTSVTIPNRVTSIGAVAFDSCSKLTSVTIGSSVTSIGESAFEGCSGLTGVIIPSSVTSIGQYAFVGCSGLTTITIGSGLTSIGGYAFYGCSGGLTSITVEADNTTYHSAGNCLIETAKGVLVAGCNNSTIPTDGSVTSIGDYAFSDCSGLTSITIPASVTSIEYGAFSGCSGLTSVTIGSGVTSIGEYAFAHCSGLTSITIPDSVTSMGYGAFYDCTKLTTIKCRTAAPPPYADPSGWDSFWRAGCYDAKVVWGYTGA